jgi:hypothetical protein
MEKLTERFELLLSPRHKQDILEAANRAGVSKAEITRRCLEHGLSLFLASESNILGTSAQGIGHAADTERRQREPVSEAAA